MRSVRRPLWTAALLAVLGAVTVGVVPGRTGAVAGAEVPANASAACGTWVLHHAGTAAELNRTRGELDTALGFSNIRGLSIKYPWKVGDANLGVLDEARRIASSRGRALAVRFVAGRQTPPSVFDAGAHHYVSSTGERIPKPFSDSGVGGNPVFEQRYEAHVARVAAWARANGVRLLHLPWYGRLSAEIDNSDELKASPGYSTVAWMEGHRRLADIAARYAGPDLAIGYVIGGVWGGFTSGPSQLLEHLVSRFGRMSGNLFVQGNALGSFSGAPPHDGAYFGMQMFDGEDYDWAAAYGTARRHGALYVEVYTSSFSLPNRGSLQSEIDRFATDGSCAGAPGAGDPFGIGPGPFGAGYRLVAGDGGVFSFGDARFLGSTGGMRLAQPVVGTAATPGGNGYWLVASDGGVFSFGDARFLGSTGGMRLAQPVVGMAATPGGNGYWLVASDGGVFSFGDARFLGSTGAIRLAQPVVGMAPTPSGNGYWLVASDGGVFSFGDARFLGSTGAIRLAQPVVGMAPTPSGNGYWLVASDGGVFSFGDARFLGSTGAIRLAQPMVGMAPTPSGNGYWLVAADGGVFSFGDARFLGSTGAIRLASRVVGLTARVG